MRTVPLGEIVVAARPKRAGASVLPVLSMTRARGLVPQDAVFTKRVASSDLSAYKVVEPGQLVVGIHPDEGAIGVAGEDQYGIVSPAYSVWTLGDTNVIHPPYLDRYIRSPRAVGYLSANYRKTADRRGKLTVEQFLELQVPLPSIEEQRRIAAVLDAADALRAKRRQALAKLDTLTQSIFIDMFGDPVTNDRGWPTRRLGDVCKRIQIGPFGSLLHQHDYVDGGIPIVNPMHIVDGTISPQRHQTITAEKHAALRTYWLEPGDVVMGRRGEMGRVAIVGDSESGYLCGSGSLFLRPEQELVTPEFVAAGLASARGRRQLENTAQGVTMMNLNSSIVENFQIGVPPIDVQRRHGKTLSRYQRVAEKHEAQCGQFDTLFASLQQRAFRGEL